MDYGYSRCSTNETKQDINRQVRELKAAGAVEIFMEYEHGDAKVKSQQQAMFAEAKEGDTIIVLEVSRLARSTQQLCEIIERVRERSRANRKPCSPRLRRVIPSSPWKSHGLPEAPSSFVLLLTPFGRSVCGW